MSNLVESIPCEDCVDSNKCLTQCVIKNKIIQSDSSLEEYQKLAMSLWFEDGSCTGGKPE
jgi:hypothetical protein